MKLEYLYAFYEYVLLPQFGINNQPVAWHRSTQLGPDETAHYFAIGTTFYILIFEDFDGLGRNSEFIQSTLGLSPNTYQFIPPEAHTANPPSFSFKLETPYRYAAEITGTFTLLQLALPPQPINTAPLQLDIQNNWGWVKLS